MELKGSPPKLLNTTFDNSSIWKEFMLLLVMLNIFEKSSSNKFIQYYL